MSCHICGREIGPRDGVHLTWSKDGDRWVSHVKCPTAPDIASELVDLLDRIWEVPPMDGQTHAEWKASRVSGSVQALVGIYNIEKRK